jgi:hypothetical protein
MTWITRRALAISVAIVFSFFATANSIAQQPSECAVGCSERGQHCDATIDCNWPLMCMPRGFFVGVCDVSICDSDADCRNRSVCSGGVCVCSRGSCPFDQICSQGICVARPAPTPHGPPPSNEGGACGVVHFGHITKHVGCLHGLICSNPEGHGTCRKPQR